MADQLQVLAGDECECICHRDPSVQHVVACCSRCENCDTRVVRQVQDTHPGRCGGFRMGRQAVRADSIFCITIGVVAVVTGFVAQVMPLGWHLVIGVGLILWGLLLWWAPGRRPLRGVLAAVIAVNLVAVVALIVLGLAASSSALTVIGWAGAAAVLGFALWQLAALRRTQGEALV